jgi:hypothetical protein
MEQRKKEVELGEETLPAMPKVVGPMKTGMYDQDAMLCSQLERESYSAKADLACQLGTLDDPMFLYFIK